MEHLLCAWDFISVLQILIPTILGEGHYLHLHMRKQHRWLSG